MESCITKLAGSLRRATLENQNLRQHNTMLEKVGGGVGGAAGRERGCREGGGGRGEGRGGCREGGGGGRKGEGERERGL